MTTLVVIALAGAAGAAARYVVTHWMILALTARRPTGAPGVNWGTHVVNVTGSMAIGVLFGMGVTASDPDLPRYALATGFLGAYTTFSTWMYESWRLFDEGRYLAPILNTVGAMLVGIAAAGAGFGIGAWIS